METITRGPFTVVRPERVDPQSPVVALLGWAGATDRPLSKFSEVLAAEGLISLRCVQPVGNIFAPTEFFRRRWAISLLDCLRELTLSPPRPLVLFAFSNGGASVVEQIYKLAERDPRYACYRQLVVGFVFDSAPAYMDDPRTPHRVLHTAMPPGWTRTLAHAAFGAISWVAPVSGRFQKSFWSSMLSLDWGKPQLYLYSQDDPLCQADRLTQLIEEKKSRGHLVTSHKWETSEHVTHFKLHRQEYLALLLPFLHALYPRDPQHTGGSEDGSSSSSSSVDPHERKEHSSSRGSREASVGGRGGISQVQQGEGREGKLRSKL